MSRKYKFHNTAGLYFVSFATVCWVDVFTRECYFKVLAESIDYCRKAKGMELYAYCFMSNHVHFIFRSSDNKPMELLRDYKKFTAKKIIEAIENNPKESRKKWLLELFKKAGKEKSNVTTYQFWQHNNHPIELWTDIVIKRYINYTHNNPVKSGFVVDPIDWKYSSARNFQDDHSVLEIDDAYF